MGVYISGMKMPKRCIDCPFIVSSDDDNCVLQTEEANAHFTSWEDMKENCPLVEVKAPHGRLVDAVALRTRMYHEAFETDSDMQRWESGCWIRYRLFERTEEAAPTIIEAEGKDDG